MKKEAPRALFLKIGDKIPSNDPSRKNQVVISIDTIDGNMTIRTDQDTWVLHPEDRLYFPRRKDGSRIDWVGVTPTLAALHHGDLLDPQMEVGPRRSPEWYLRTKAEQAAAVDKFARYTHIKRSYQIVQYVSMVNGNYILHTYDAWGKEHEFVIRDKNVPLVFPMTDRLEYDPKEQREVNVAFFGPYRESNPDDPEHPRIAWFAKHPFGKGRWPMSIKPYDRYGSGQMRPPRTEQKALRPDNQQGDYAPLVGEWNRWVYQGEPNLRHPLDPVMKQAKYRRRKAEEGAIIDTEKGIIELKWK